MIKHLWSACAAAAVLAASAGIAHAGDLFPPSPSNPLAPWNRGDPRTTTSVYRFPSPGQLPDIWMSEPALPTTSTLTPGPGSLWLPGPPGTTYEGGVWCIQNPTTGGLGFIEFLVPNYFRPDPKIVYVQLKFFGDVPQVDVFDPQNPPPTGPMGVPWSPIVFTPEPVQGGPPGLTQWSTSLCLPYNPQFEIVRIHLPAGSTGTTYIDQVIIDTICTPAPGAGTLLALGGVIAFRRRR